MDIVLICGTCIVCTGAVMLFIAALAGRVMQDSEEHRRFLHRAVQESFDALTTRMTDITMRVNSMNRNIDAMRVQLSHMASREDDLR